MRWLLVLSLLAASTAVADDAAPPASPSALVVVIDRALPADKLDVVTRGLTDALGKLEPGQQLGVVAAGKTAQVVVALDAIDDASSIASRPRGVRASKTGDVLAGMRGAGTLLAKATSGNRRLLVVTDGDELLALGPMRSPATSAGSRSCSCSIAWRRCGAHGSRPQRRSHAARPSCWPRPIRSR